MKVDSRKVLRPNASTVEASLAALESAGSAGISDLLAYRNSGGQTITHGSGVNQQVALGSQAAARGTNITQATNQITVAQAGIYQVSFNCWMTVNSSAVQVFGASIETYLNGASIQFSKSGTASSVANAEFTVSGNFVTQLAANDVLKWIANVTNATTDGVMHDFRVSVIKL